MEFTLARPEHEPQLRELLRTQPMPGWVRLAYEREPDFFAAAAIQGPVHQTIVATHHGTVAGMGSRALREVYLNGTPMHFGYLGGLRSRESARGGTGLARGYGFLRRLHEDGLVPGYLTTIIEDNHAARRLLTSGRTGLPHYRDLGRFFTYATPPGRRAPGCHPRRDLAISHAAPGEGEELDAFLDEQGSRRQFFPVVRVAEFGTPLWRGLALADFYVARESGGRIAAIVGCWDQSAFKQLRITGYAPSLRFVRPLANAGLRIAGRPTLPHPGEYLRLLMLCLVSVRDDDPATLAALLERVARDFRGRGFHQLCLGFHERDPLRPAVEGRGALRYPSRLYGVSWGEGSVFKELEPRRVPHLEVALL